MESEGSGDTDVQYTTTSMGFSIDKSLEVGKEEKEQVLKKGIQKGQKVSYVTKFDTGYLKKMLRSSGVDKQRNKVIKYFLKQKL